MALSATELSPVEKPESGNRSGLHKNRRAVGVLAALFVISRVIAWLVGVRFDVGRLTGRRSDASIQLLDPGLLQHHLVASVWVLDSQPPFFNLLAGVLLKMPDALRPVAATWLYLICGLTMVLASYLILVDLRTPRSVAMVAAMVLIANPSFVLYENWLDYGYLAAGLVTTALFGLVRFVRTERWVYGLLSSGSAAGVVLLDSTYQYVWLVVVLALPLVLTKVRVRTVIVTASIPVLCVGLWAAKDALQFETFTTSSWLGMNLTKTTLDSLSPSQLDRLVKDGTLTSIARVPAFAPVDVYVPRWAAAPTSGNPALSRTTIADGLPNFNNEVYVGVSKAYLADDLAFIRTHPRLYATTFVDAGKLFVVPPDQYGPLTDNARHISGWTRLYDAVLMGQLVSDSNPAGKALYFREAPGKWQISYFSLFTLFLVLFGAPLVAWTRRVDPALRVGLTFVWITVAYVALSTSLIEFGENERYAMGLGPLPLIGAILVLAAAWRTMRPVRSENRRGASA